MSWAVVVGGKGQGRAEVAEAVCQRLQSLGVRVGGFSVRARESHPKDLELVEIPTGARVFLAREPPLAPDDPLSLAQPDVCSFHFDPAAFTTGRTWARKPGNEVAMLGGLATLEASGRGFSSLVYELASSDGLPLPVLVIRREAFQTLALALPGEPIAAIELPCPALTEAVEDFSLAVRGAVQNLRDST